MQQLEQENANLRTEVGKVEQTKQDVEKDAASRSALTLQSGAGLSYPADSDINKYVTTGGFPGSIVLPGTNVSIQIGGFVQLDAISDGNAIGSKDSFIVSSIPTAGDTAGQTQFSVRQTRLFVRTEAPTEWGAFVTHVEGDFFGPDGTDFRLRHAYGEIGDKHKLLAGQTWSTFADASVYPAIFDYQGPNGGIFPRQPMIRYTEVVRPDFQWQVAVEDPNPDVSTATTISPGNDTARMPDLIGNIRWMPDWGHLQLAGILRELTFDPVSGPRSTDIGWGFNFTGMVKVFEPVEKGKQDNFTFEALGGQGIENYINDSGGLGLDGFVDAGGDLSALGVYGGFIAYQHYWSAKWASSLGYSFLHVDDKSGQGGGTYKEGHYGVVNIMYYPVDRIWMGLEGLYGIREDQDGSSGSDGRLSLSVQYRF